MNIRIYRETGAVDINNVNDNARVVQAVIQGERAAFVIGDIGGDYEFNRTDEIEQGRVVFR